MLVGHHPDALVRCTAACTHWVCAACGHFEMHPAIEFDVLPSLQ